MARFVNLGNDHMTKVLTDLRLSPSVFRAVFSHSLEITSVESIFARQIEKAADVSAQAASL